MVTVAVPDLRGGGGREFREASSTGARPCHPRRTNWVHLVPTDGGPFSLCGQRPAPGQRWAAPSNGARCPGCQRRLEQQCEAAAARARRLLEQHDGAVQSGWVRAPITLTG